MRKTMVIARLQRSELAVPATSTHFFAKAIAGPTDSLFLDLEDAVAPARRAEGRANAVDALTTLDWGQKVVSVRVNGLGTPWAVADILAVARCPRLDMILLPKVETPGDVEFLDRLLTGLELETPRLRPLGIEILSKLRKAWPMWRQSPPPHPARGHHLWGQRLLYRAGE